MWSICFFDLYRNTSYYKYVRHISYCWVTLTVSGDVKTVALCCMCEMWAGCFCGYPCQTNEPAELAGGIGGSVDWSRAKQREFPGSLSLWFPCRGSRYGSSATLTTSASVSPVPLWVASRKHPPAKVFKHPKVLHPFVISLLCLSPI